MASCFILRRNREKSLYLTPFIDPKLAPSWKEDDEIHWLASTGLNTHEKDDALFILYTQIDHGVDRWIQDARYIPRLLVSSAVFLTVYFFFSLAVRDPIPMVDELVLAIVASFLAAYALSKRDKKGELAMKRRLELKQNASRCDYSILEGLSSYEAYLDTCSYLDTLDLADRLALTGDADLPALEIAESETGPWQKEFKDILLRHFELTDRPLYALYVQVMRVRTSETGDEAFAARLIKLAMHKNLDLPLLALLVVASKQ
ncbi:MAG: hypothetical protein AB7S52_08990 [Sphaerochaetaceae bacterium]